MKLRRTVIENGLEIKVLGRRYSLSENSVVDQDNQKELLGAFAILNKYILLGPKSPPTDTYWAANRYLRDTTPLQDYFAIEVEETLTELFSCRLHCITADSLCPGRLAGLES
jgi:hypothetical protein